jgi:hypothetical protein
MDVEQTVRCIGLSHLLQPPLTLVLARQLRLKPSFEALPPIAFRIAQNMAVAAVALPTSLGIYVALNAADAVRLGPTWSLALGVAAFWTWRLERQLRALGPLLVRVSAFWHPLLTLIFTLQGPLLGALMLLLRVRGGK